MNASKINVTIVVVLLILTACEHSIGRTIAPAAVSGATAPGGGVAPAPVASGSSAPGGGVAPAPVASGSSAPGGGTGAPTTAGGSSAPGGGTGAPTTAGGSSAPGGGTGSAPVASGSSAPGGGTGTPTKVGSTMLEPDEVLLIPQNFEKFEGYAPSTVYHTDTEQIEYRFIKTGPDPGPLSSTRTRIEVNVQVSAINLEITTNPDGTKTSTINAPFTETYDTQVDACYGLGDCKDSDYTRRPELEQRYDITRDPSKPENQQIQSRTEYQRVPVYDKDDKLTNTIDLPATNIKYDYTKDGYQTIARAEALGPDGKVLYAMEKTSEYDATSRQNAYNSAYNAYYAALSDLPETERKEKAEELAWEQLRDTTNNALKGGASVFDIGNYAQQWGAWMKAYQDFGLVDSLTTLFMPERAQKIQEKRKQIIEKYALLAGTRPILNSVICGQYYPDESNVLLTTTQTGQVQPTATITATKSNPIHLKGPTKQQMIDLLGETITIGTTTYNLTTDTIDQDLTVTLYHIQATLTTDKNREYNIQFNGDTTKNWYSTNKPIQATETETINKYKYATNNYQTACLTFNPGITSSGRVKHQLCTPIIEYQGPPTTYEQQQLEDETPEFIIEGDI